MKKTSIRILLLTLYILAAWVNLTLLPATFDLWNSVLAAGFAGATRLFAGRATSFIFLTVFVASCAAPVAALSTFSRSLHGSWIESCWSVILDIFTYNPLHGLELVFPSLAAAIAVILTQLWLNRNKATAT